MNRLFTCRITYWLNKDKNDVLVDTGSSDLWVMSHDLNCVSASSSSGSSKRRKRDPRMYLVTSSVPETKERNSIKIRRCVEDANKRADSYYTTIYLSEMPDGTNLPAPGGGIGSGSSSSRGSGSGQTPVRLMAHSIRGTSTLLNAMTSAHSKFNT
ncbi:unnamed protein product [Candida parapsilosis]